MNKKDLMRMLHRRWLNAGDLRKEFSGIRALLGGEFDDRFNVYEQPQKKYHQGFTGLVVSRSLIQGLEKNPTIGIISPGIYSFNTGKNIETMTVLDGDLDAYVSGENATSHLEKYGSIMVPAGKTLELQATEDEPVFYLCQYKPKK